MKQGWKNYLIYASVVIVGGGLVFILLETVLLKNTGFEVKTLWDWMELFVIPLVLAFGAFYLNRSERNAEREIATDRQQEAALQAYIDRMAELLLKEKLRTTENAEVQDVARTRTLTVLRGLDAGRKGQVIQFLYEANLINKSDAIVHLHDADLKDANLEATSLEGADLKHTYLEGANMYFANLEGADLEFANLEGAGLTDAHLADANLIATYLGGANLTNANLERADLTNSRLDGANLTDAHLVDANFSYANLMGGKVTNEQLATVKSLKGATMPDGTIHD